MSTMQPIDRAFAALPRLVPDAADTPRRAMVTEAAIRLDEAAEAVRTLVADAMARRPEDSASAESAASQGYRQLAMCWPPERRRVLDGYFQGMLARARRTAETRLEAQARAERPRRLLHRLAVAAAEGLEAARGGRAEDLDGAVRRALVLRDLAVRLGILDPTAAERLTAGYAADLAEAQVRGEIRRLSEVDPLAAIGRALHFVLPDATKAEAAFLRRVALDEAEEALRAAETARRAAAEKAATARHVTRVEAFLRRCSVYMTGGASAVDTVRRAPMEDAADTMRDLWDGLHRTDPLSGAEAVLAAGCVGRAGGAHLLMFAGRGILRSTAARAADWFESLGEEGRRSSDFALPPCLACAGLVDAALASSESSGDGKSGVFSSRE